MECTPGGRGARASREAEQDGFAEVPRARGLLQRMVGEHGWGSNQNIAVDKIPAVLEVVRLGRRSAAQLLGAKHKERE